MSRLETIQNGIVQHATRENYNMFETNLLRIQGVTCRTTNIEFEKQTQALNDQIQDWKGNWKWLNYK
jgi:hypothetical protein